MSVWLSFFPTLNGERPACSCVPVPLPRVAPSNIKGWLTPARGQTPADRRDGKYTSKEIDAIVTTTRRIYT